MKEVIIIGGGPAGLTAAYELLKKSSEYHVTLFEESNTFGGISKTVNYTGNRMDMGGHRFFSKVPEVNTWWEDLLPCQGKPSKDDILLDRCPPLSQNGPDPEKSDEVMLIRRRVSRIFFDGKFYDYPISLKPETFRNMGLKKTLQCGFSYIGSMLHKLPEDNLENFYINSFGRQLYSMFFEYYTENLWGRHPSEIDASWGAQRTKGLSIMGIIKDVLGKTFNPKNREVNTSLIEEFKYPKLGPGQLWEITAAKVEEMGGTILKNTKVESLKKEGNRIDALFVSLCGLSAIYLIITFVYYGTVQMQRIFLFVGIFSAWIICSETDDRIIKTMVLLMIAVPSIFSMQKWFSDIRADISNEYSSAKTMSEYIVNELPDDSVVLLSYDSLNPPVVAYTQAYRDDIVFFDIDGAAPFDCHIWKLEYSEKSVSDIDDTICDHFPETSNIYYLTSKDYPKIDVAEHFASVFDTGAPSIIEEDYILYLIR